MRLMKSEGWNDTVNSAVERTVTHCNFVPANALCTECRPNVYR